MFFSGYRMLKKAKAHIIERWQEIDRYFITVWDRQTFSRCNFVSFKTADISKCENINIGSVILAMKTGYNSIVLQSVESDEEILNEEWKDLNWKSIEYGIFKIQKRIFEAKKEGNYRKANNLARLLVNDKRSLL